MSSSKSTMLNPQQMAAVKYVDGPLLVLAGAGSGKTRVITEKIAYLIRECGYTATNLCAVTFTNKAANEMRTRISTVLPANLRRGLKIATFHTLGLTIIKRHLQVCHLRPNFSIFDGEDSLTLLRQFLSSSKTHERDYLIQVQQQISRWKNELINPEQINPNLNTDQITTEAALLYPRYQHALEAYNAVDFDDLIRLPVTILSTHPELLMYWQNKIRHLLIDEYQDSNTSQYQLVKLLVGTKAHFTIVGDDDQSIYAWRGAKPENLIQLEQDFSNLRLIKLEQNYRSTNRILHAANYLIANNTHLFLKKLWSEWGPGELIRILCCHDEHHEVEQVVADLISHKLRRGTRYGDYAILYRSNHQARLFEKILRQHDITYQLSGGQSWFARTEIKDILAYLKLLCNQDDDAAFLRVINTPNRGIGEKSLDTLGRHAQKREQSLFICADHLALSEQLTEKPRLALERFKHWINGLKIKIQTTPVIDVLKTLVEESGYETYLYSTGDTPTKTQKRMDNIWDLLAWIQRLLDAEPSSSLSDVINKLILIDILEQNEDHSTDTLHLMTLHTSKGLEFPYVYLVGVEEEILPHRNSIETNEIEEERRLMYVGITRAQKELCLTFAKQRRRAGGLEDCKPSRFLDELPTECIEWYGKTKEHNEERAKLIAKSHLEGLKNLLA